MDTSSMVERAVGRQDGYSGTGPRSPLRVVGGRGPTQDAALSTADTAWHVAQIEQGQERGAAAPTLTRATRGGAGWGNNRAGALIAGAARGRRAGLSRGWARVSHSARRTRPPRASMGNALGRNQWRWGAIWAQPSSGAIGAQSGCTRRLSVTIQCNQALNSRARQGCNRGAIGVHSAPLGHNPVRAGAQLEGAPAGSETNRLHSGRIRGAFGAQSVRTPGQSGRSRGRAQSGRTRRHSVSISVSSAAVQVGRDPVSLGRHPGRDAVSCCMRMTCMARQASGLEGVGQVESRVAWLPIGQCNDVIVDTKH